MDENNNPQDEQNQGLDLVTDGSDAGKAPLKRKVAIGAAVALVVGGARSRRRMGDRRLHTHTRVLQGRGRHWCQQEAGLG